MEKKIDRDPNMRFQVFHEGNYIWIYPYRILSINVIEVPGVVEIFHAFDGKSIKSEVSFVYELEKDGIVNEINEILNEHN